MPALSSRKRRSRTTARRLPAVSSRTRKQKGESSTSVRNLIVISDLHCGSRLGLLHEKGIEVDEGLLVKPSKAQLVLYTWWREFWDEWVPHVCHGEPYVLIVNGDCLEGKPHQSKAVISDNLDDQQRIAEDLLREPVSKAAAYYHVRGTEAHVGKSAEAEELLARTLQAIPNQEGQYSRYDLWYSLGSKLIHFLHHVGTCSSNAYETTALMKEWSEEQTESARWGQQPPDVVVRSHRHRHAQITVPTAGTYGYVFVTPAWQLKTPFAWKVAGARLSPPQIGGSLIRLGDEDLYCRHFVKAIGRTRSEQARQP